MLCSLLRTFKVFFVGNALFSSRAIVHLDRNRSMAAITYHLEHDALHIDHTVTLVQDPRYHSCFEDHPHTVTDHYLFLGPELKEKLRRMDRIVVQGGKRVDCECPGSGKAPIQNKAVEEIKPTVAPSSSGSQMMDGEDKKKVESPGSPSRRPLFSPIPSSSNSSVSRTHMLNVTSTGNPMNPMNQTGTMNPETNTSVPLWSRTGVGKEQETGRPIPSNRHHPTSESNHTAHGTRHEPKPTELLLEYSTTLREQSDAGSRVHDGDASPGDRDRISPMKQFTADESDTDESDEE